MSTISHHEPPVLDIAVRVGCKLVYSVNNDVPTFAILKPQQEPTQSIRQESIQLSQNSSVTEYRDEHGNVIYRMLLVPGEHFLTYDAIVMVPSVREDAWWSDVPTPVNELPSEILRYTQPSRYCDSDRLADFAWNNFGHLPAGLSRVLAICEWIHANIEYRTGSGSPFITANDVIQRRFGVCRDFAHCAVALCRAMNLPARYVSGYVSDIAWKDDGRPMDFHAYMEVWLDQRWQTFDARFLKPRIGRVRISSGYDAGSCAFGTFFGPTLLQYFEVWSYQVDPREVHIGDPVDLSKRLCGQPELRFPTNATQTAFEQSA
ncbi:MAG: transglutaminase family protein [Chthoniobacterales bacterium]